MHDLEGQGPDEEEVAEVQDATTANSAEAVNLSEEPVSVEAGAEEQADVNPQEEEAVTDESTERGFSTEASSESAESGESTEVVTSAEAPSENAGENGESPQGVKPSAPGTIAVSGKDNPNLKWYVVNTYSGYEEKARLAFFQRVKDKKLEDLVGEAHIPQTHKETRTKTGKKRVVSRTSFPGYMMLQLELNDVTKLLVKETPKITGFVGDSMSPKPLGDREVLNMFSVEPEQREEVAVAEPEVLYNKGDAIRVIDGPFSNFDGVIDEVRPEKMKVRVLVSIFGRETPVELEFRQIEQV